MLKCNTTGNRKQVITYLDVLLGIFKVFKESIITPLDTRLLVGTGVRVSVSLSRLASEKAVEIGALLVGSSFLDSVTLRALGLEDLGSLLLVSWFLAHFE